jgi:Glycosyl transferases group 1
VDLIRAVALLRLEFPTLRLEIAGAGPQREDLEGEVERLGLRGSVRLLGWQRDLGPLFQSWDIFAMPSLEEGFGMAALEAMADGLPVVATSVGGLPEVIEDGQTATLSHLQMLRRSVNACDSSFLTQSVDERWELQDESGPAIISLPIEWSRRLGRSTILLSRTLKMSPRSECPCEK